MKTYDQRPKKVMKAKRKSLNRFHLFIFLLVIILVAFYGLKQTARTYDPSNSSTTSKLASTACGTNNLAQLILVSISQRHLWACSGHSVTYNSPVITGMDFLAADLTPTGTFHIYAKETDQDLTGCDTTGCWNDNVDYWMPFLDNQYGQYGFHDAMWRPTNEFGKVSPGSANASHGCVEMPLQAAKWLYGWAQVGTTVTIEA